MIARRILVVDDEEAIQFVIQGCLEDLATWDVVTASSGYEGIELAASQQFDVIQIFNWTL